jgi:hypothetical protein
MSEVKQLLSIATEDLETAKFFRASTRSPLPISRLLCHVLLLTNPTPIRRIRNIHP